MSKNFGCLFLMIVLLTIGVGCGGREFPTGWSQGPEFIPVNICPDKPFESDLDRRAMLAAVDVFHQYKFGVHSVDPNALVVNSGYGASRGIVSAWRFQVEGHRRGMLTVAKTSPEHTGRAIHHVTRIATSMASLIGRNSCLSIDVLEERTAVAGVAIPKGIPKAARNEAPREAVPASDGTAPKQAVESASGESTAPSKKSVDAGHQSL